MPALRKYYKGPKAPIVAAVCAAARVPDFLSYSERLDAPLQVAKIIPHRKMWQEIRQQHGTLSFAQSFVEEVLDEVATINGEKIWKRALTPTELADWKPSAARMFRSMARAISQAGCKSTTPAWLTQLWGGAAERSVDATSPSADAASLTCATSSARASIDDYFYGYDNEHQQAYRVPASNAHAAWEYAVKPLLAGIRNGDEHPWATFSSGPEVRITSVTSQQLKDDATSQDASRGALWQGTHGEKRVYIARRKDRHPLLIMFRERGEGSKAEQLCQVRIDIWGSDDHALNRCLSAFSGVASALCCGALDEDGLYAARDRLVEARKAPAREINCMLKHKTRTSIMRTHKRKHKFSPPHEAESQGNVRIKPAAAIVDAQPAQADSTHVRAHLKGECSKVRAVAKPTKRAHVGEEDGAAPQTPPRKVRTKPAAKVVDTNADYVLGSPPMFGLEEHEDPARQRRSLTLTGASTTIACMYTPTGKSKYGPALVPQTHTCLLSGECASCLIFPHEKCTKSRSTW